MPFAGPSLPVRDPEHAEDALAGWIAEGLGSGDVRDIDGVLVDLRALQDRLFACRPLLCTPGQRARGVLSCCADIAVPLTARERRAIVRHLPAVAEVMAARDPRWRDGPPDVFADPRTLARSHRRCVFAYPSADGLRCGLHTTAETRGIPLAQVKPSPCRLFPLALLQLGSRTILTASVQHVSAALGGPPERALRCLEPESAEASDVPPLYVSCRETIEAEWGAAFYRRLGALARARAQRRR